MLTIDLKTAQRFVLGKQGLWPGRRWRGFDGTTQAMQAMEYLQLDPLQIIARSQDIALHSRVLDYQPGRWEVVTYQQRKFFDWGGWLAVRPIGELPYWRVVMQRERDQNYGDSRIRKMAIEHAEVIAEMRAILAERGTVSNREFEMATRTRMQSYRGRKDSALALYYLWRVGDVMTHHRENFERVYALTENVAPTSLIREMDGSEVDRFLVRKEVSFSGLSRLNRTPDGFHGRGEPDRAAKKLLHTLLDEGELIEVKVEDWKPIHYALRDDEKFLLDVIAGRIPKAWRPLETTTLEEAVFLAPLDHVIARGRAKVLFGFDYIWEVYKPAEKRKFGYYTLPVVWDDQLVARFDSKYDRATSTFVILGLWLEEETLIKNAEFTKALVRGFARFAGFLGATAIDANRLAYLTLRRQIRDLSFDRPR